MMWPLLILCLLSKSSSQEENFLKGIISENFTEFTVTEENFLQNITTYFTSDDVLEKFLRSYPVESWKKFGLFTESYLKSINIHWLQFPPPNPANHYALAGLYTGLLVVGLSGNALVIFMITRCQTLRTPGNTLVLNLAVSDFLMMAKIPIFIINSIYMGPVFGDKGCRIYGFFGGLTGTVSICSLAVISLDRYYVVKFPLSRRFNQLRVKICVVLTWVYGATFSVIPLLNVGLGSYVPEGYLTSCSFDYLTDDPKKKTFIWVFFCAAWVVPFTVITFAYVNIIYVVIVKSNTKKNNFALRDSKRHQKGETKRNQEIRLTVVVFLIIAVWFLAWTPYAIVALLGITNRKELIKPITSMVPALFCKTASCIDPFIYAITNQRFRIEFLKLFCRNSSRMRRQSSSIYWKHSGRSSSDNRRPRNGENGQRKLSLEMVQLDPVTDIGNAGTELKISVVTDFQQETCECKPPPWWFKPNFSNKSGSLRELVTKLSRQKTRKVRSCED